jgi:tetratricopeptide (TPR) repeat protein
LKGRYFFNRPSAENLTKAITLFEEAVRLNPNFAPAYSGLSDAVLWAGYNEDVLTAAEAKPRAKAAAEKAIELDDNSAEAHASFATYKFFYDFDWEASEKEFRRSFALNPSYAFSHDQFGLSLAFQGRWQASQAEGKRAAELDPLSPQIAIDALFGLVGDGKSQAARNEVKRAADLDPSFFFAPWGGGWIDIQEGKLAEAIPQLQKSKAMDAPTFVSAWLGYAYGASGDRTRAMAELDELKKKSSHGKVLPFNQALIISA